MCDGTYGTGNLGRHILNCFRFIVWGDITIATDGYLFLIAHLQQLVPSERALNFYFIPPPHSGVVLCEKIYILLSE